VAEPPKKKQTLLADQLGERWKELFKHIIVTEGEMDARLLRSFVLKRQDKDGKDDFQIVVNSGLTQDLKRAVIDKEIRQIVYLDDTVFATTNYDRLLEGLLGEEKKAEVTVSSVIIPEQKSTEGVLVKSASLVWASIVDELELDWRKAYEIPPHVWEEIVAGAYNKAGFDEVTLTPRSGDHGRDVIAIKKGIGSIKIIGSVKAYKPGLLVGYDDIRALLGVMSGERDTSKGIITTTSDFPPKVGDDPFIAPFLPTRLELMNGSMLKDWLLELRKKK
jgi:restriction system protein